MTIEIILGSASSARADILRRAGLPFRQRPADIDEEALAATIALPREQAQALATAKAHAVADLLLTEHQITRPTYIIAADSVFEFEGKPYGKPLQPDVARARWQAQRGKTGTLHSGHCVIAIKDHQKREVAEETVSANVSFATVSDAVIEDYIATGEPFYVAGGFTLEGHGATMIDRVEGDPNAVLGLSLRAIRELLESMGVTLTKLWQVAK